MRSKYLAVLASITLISSLIVGLASSQGSAQVTLPPFETTVVLPAGIAVLSKGGASYDIIARAAFFQKKPPFVALRFTYIPEQDLQTGTLLTQELRMNKATGAVEATTISSIRYEAVRRSSNAWQVSAMLKTSDKTFSLVGNVASDSNPLLPHSSIEKVQATSPRRQMHVPDGLKFSLRGVKVKYDHPNRFAYNLNPSEFRVLSGKIFYHIQLSRSLSGIFKLPPQVLGAIIGATIMFLINPSPDPVTKSAGTLLGAIVGFTLPAIGQFLQEQYILDEDGATWFWIKKRDYEALIRALKTFHGEQVEYLKIGDLPAISVPLPFGRVRIIKQGD